MGKYGDFTPSYPGLGEVLRSPEMVGAMEKVGMPIYETAVATSPVGDAAKGDKHPGEYKAGWEHESGVEHSLVGVRAFFRVRNTVGHSAAVEFGNARSPAQHVLGRAIDAAGG